MNVKELNLILGGPQGAGLETTAQVLTFALSSLRYGVLSDREYFSNIKGRHSYVHFRISSQEFPKALRYPVQVIGSMDAETVFTHFEDLEEGGYLVYDTNSSNQSFMTIPSMEHDLKHKLQKKFSELGLTDKLSSLLEYLEKERKIKLIGLNFREILKDLREKFNLSPVVAQRYTSSIIVGAVAALIGLDKKGLEYALKRRFGARQTILEHNNYLVNRVYDMVYEKFGSPYKLEESKINEKELIVASGNDITAMGKITGGLRIQTYYPITPAADESFYIEAKENLEANGKRIGGIVVFQNEDELAAITSAIGAALTGARSATATSGPGFSLMAEALGWAGINEVPVVITYYQRGGPSTGLPTRGSQSDLFFTLFASHGEFPRIVIASGDHEEAFFDAIDAFNYAERYQTPVIHLLDKYLANSITNMPLPDFSKIKIDRGKLVEGYEGYKRFDKSEPISPRAPLGSNAVMWYTGDEHDEYGHIDEDPDNRIEMYDKRMKKLEIADKEIPPERRAVLYGDGDADVLLVGWGFVKGVALDAIRELKNMGVKAAYLHLRVFSPFPSEYVKNILEKFERDRIIAVEHNYLAQAAQIITMNTGLTLKKAILKYTGRPIYTNELVEAVKEILEGKDRVVLRYGA